MKSQTIQPKVVYSDKYNFNFDNSLLDLVRELHPFDSHKYANVWKIITNSILDIDQIKIDVDSIITENELKLAHSEEYLKKLLTLSYIAKAIEMPELAVAVKLLSVLPCSDISESSIRKSILDPMKWATKGTILAGYESLENGIAINLSGGYHHASRNKGEGFCIYSDVAIAIKHLQKNEKLTTEDNILIVDLDVHQGNGLERIFHDDNHVHIFDMYNGGIYPQDQWARKRVNNNFDLPLNSGMEDDSYLTTLHDNLPRFITSVQSPKIAFYIAGTDVFEEDPLGEFNVSENGILARDKYVIDTLVDNGIPCVMVLGGGYTKQSATIIANSIKNILTKYQ
jgi:histone deacetylase 11